VTLTFAELIAN